MASLSATAAQPVAQADHARQSAGRASAHPTLPQENKKWLLPHGKQPSGHLVDAAGAVLFTC
ncbi:hypothetical protein [Aquitalea magnusonii]|uniref:hypothetical protein n=1 Tax=Aquitalea magnusonii TaxID=332411 RepID=UPI0011B6597E|nr:hypothetical protein [Aquitalea magnusonii]